MTADRADFGERLRQAREARGMSLAQVAAATKISPLALEALERNDVSRLPGGLFSRAFVRAYAREVGLDPEQTTQEFVERFEDVSERNAPIRSRSTGVDATATPGSHARWFGLFVTIALIAAFVVVSRYLNRPDSTPSSVPAQAPHAGGVTHPDAPPRTAPDVNSTPAPGNQASAPSAPGTPAAASPTPAPSGASPTTPPPGSEVQAPPAVTGTANAPTVEAPTGQVPSQAAAQPTAPAGGAPSANLPLRVVLAPKAACWVSAKVDGKQVPGRLLQPGERLELAAADSIAITAGDAGALGYTVNNAPGRPLGDAGQVAKVVITSANYQSFVAR